MKKSLPVLIMSLLFITAFLSGLNAETVILDIEKSVDLALENNLELKSSRMDVEIKKRAADLSWNRFIPTVQASGTLMRWNQEQSGAILTGYDQTGSV